MRSIDLLRRLSEAHGVHGSEDEVRDILRAEVEPLVDEVRTDAMGNLLCIRRGSREDVLMLDAHMDEVGFLVAWIEESGFLRLAPVGGWDPRVLLSHAMTIRTRDGDKVRGVIGTSPPHVLREEERSRAVKIEDMFVDIGAGSSAQAAEMGVRIGDPCMPSYPFETLGDDLVMGKAFDDRAGCAMAIHVLEELGDAQPDMTIAVAFTVGEEVGLRGARTAAFQLKPAVALALEGTTAVDVPGVPPARRPATFGKGPAISIADSSMIADKRVVRLLEDVAEAEGIAYQHKVPIFGGTDAGAIQISGAGAMCGVVSVPCRYIHTPLTLLRPSELEACVQLVTAFVRRASSLLP